MLKLFASQKNSTALLFRACLPSAVSWSLGNTHILKDFRRSLSDDCPLGSELATNKVPPLPSKGYYHVWSLISNEKDALLEIVDLTGPQGPTFRCAGEYDQSASLVEITDSTVFPTPSVSFRMTLKGTNYYLSLENGKIVARALVNQLQDRERFIHLTHGSYSMFENVAHRDYFLGSCRGGSLHLANLHDKVFPDPRVLFLMHSKFIKNA